MKHIRLFDKKDGLMQDVTTNPSADYPVIALCKNEDELSFWNTPIIKAKYNITSDDDVKSCIQSDYNIKSLTIDGELKFKKNTWVKYEYQLTQNDFQKENSIVKKIYVKLNSGCRNVYLKSNEKATQFLLIYPQGNINNINQKFLNIEETKESLFIKQIDEYTYDLTNFYLYYDKTIHNAQINLVGIFLADSEGNVLTQNLEFECFDVRNEQIEHHVTKENFFNTDICFGEIVDISGDTNVNINKNDYLLLFVVVNGKMHPYTLISIEYATTNNFASLSNNILHVDISGLVGFGLLYVILDQSYKSDESGVNMEGIAKFVKNCTIKGKKYFPYTPILSVGEHDIEVELLQQLYTPFFETNALVDLDMSHVNGKYIHINNICNNANKLKQVRLSNSLNSIGTYAFYYCSGLTSIAIPSSVKSIGTYAFDGCSSLTSVTIPNSVKSIGTYAFNNCTSLTSITIPNSVTSIGTYAFNNCTSLTSVTIPNSVKSIGDDAFYGCFFQLGKLINNSSVTTTNNFGAKIFDIIQEDGLCINDENAVDCRPNATNVTIPSGVTSIYEFTFYGCTSLTSITIPNSVISIGGRAFRSCSSLTSVTIPDRVTSIGGWAFESCRSLTSITIPSRVTSINKDTFYNCTSLTSVIIPDGVRSIGDGAFRYCVSLTSVTIPSSVTTIYSNAFSGCYFDSDNFSQNSSLGGYPWGAEICDTIQDDGLCISGTTAVKCRPNATSVTIPNGVTSIRYNAFSDITSLSSITIPNSVTSIGRYAFQRCPSLTYVTCYATTAPTLDSDAFSNISTNGTLYVPNGSDYSSWLSSLPSGWAIAYI